MYNYNILNIQTNRKINNNQKNSDSESDNNDLDNNDDDISQNDNNNIDNSPKLYQQTDYGLDKNINKNMTRMTK